MRECLAFSASLMPNVLPGSRRLEADKLFFFKEKLCGALNAVRGAHWEKVTLTVDSGASDTVVPLTVCPGVELMYSSRVCIEFEIADGSTIENLGERHCLTQFPSKE